MNWMKLRCLMGKGLVPAEKTIISSKENIFVCISQEMFHIRVPNLIDPDHPCMHIIQQHQDLQVYPPLPSLLVHKPIFHLW